MGHPISGRRKNPKKKIKAPGAAISGKELLSTIVRAAFKGEKGVSPATVFVRNGLNARELRKMGITIGSLESAGAHFSKPLLRRLGFTEEEIEHSERPAEES